MHIKNCPICNSRSIKIHGSVFENSSKFLIECLECRYRTHEYRTYDKALSEWNFVLAEESIRSDTLQLKCRSCDTSYEVRSITLSGTCVSDNHFPYASNQYKVSGYTIVCPKCNKAYDQQVLYDSKLKAIMHANREYARSCSKKS